MRLEDKMAATMAKSRERAVSGRFSGIGAGWMPGATRQGEGEDHLRRRRVRPRRVALSHINLENRKNGEKML